MRMTRLCFTLALAFALQAAAGEPLAAGKYNEVVDIGAEMPSFSDLPTTGGTLSSKDLVEDVLAGRTVPVAETRAQGCNVEYEQAKR